MEALHNVAVATLTFFAWYAPVGVLHACRDAVFRRQVHYLAAHAALACATLAWGPGLSNRLRAWQCVVLAWPLAAPWALLLLAQGAHVVMRLTHGRNLGDAAFLTLATQALLQAHAVYLRNALAMAYSQEDWTMDPPEQAATDEACCICLESLAPTARLRLRCRHVLHPSCFATLREHGGSTCPLCRESILSNRPLMKNGVLRLPPPVSARPPNDDA